MGITTWEELRECSTLIDTICGAEIYDGGWIIFKRWTATNEYETIAKI